MLKGEQKDPEYTRQVGLDGVVPGIQFRRHGTDGAFVDAIQGVERIFRELRTRFPEAFPHADAAIAARACEGPASIFGRLRVARRAYEACAGASGPDPLALGLAGALSDLDALLAETGGPFVGGAHPTAADLMLLPLLERTEAVVPYFYGDAALAALPFERAATMLRAARARRDGAFGA
eukprot:259508-Prymnesium_polylepis.1